MREGGERAVMKAYGRSITGTVWAVVLFMTILGGISRADDVENLLHSLQSTDPPAREKAATALGGTKDPSAIKPLIKTLADEYKYVRRAAAEALGKMGEPAVEPLAKALKNENSNVREGALTALGLIGNPTVVPVMLQAVHDEDVSVREASVEALGRIHDERAEAGLVRVMMRNRDWDLRGRAAEALKKAGWTPKDSREQAFVFLASEQWAKLAHLGERALEPLMQALSDRDGSIRAKAAHTLGRCNNPMGIPPLVKALRDKNEAVRENAGSALRSLGWTPSVPEDRAWSLLANQEWDALVELGKPAVDPLLVATTDGRAKVRLAAALALGEIRDRRAVEPLAALLEDNDADVRSSAARALGMIRDPKAAQKLFACLADKSRHVRAAALTALKTINAIGSQASHGKRVNTLVLPRIAATDKKETSAVIELQTRETGLYHARSLDGKSRWSTRVYRLPMRKIFASGGTVHVETTMFSQSSIGPVTVRGIIIEGSYFVGSSLDISGPSGSMGPTDWDGRNPGAVHRIFGNIAACDYQISSDPGNPLVFMVTRNGYRYLHGSGMVRDTRSGDVFILRDDSKEALLRKAAAEGDKASAEKLLREGTSVNAKLRFRNSPLMIACRMGHVDLVKLLLERGADVNTRDVVSGRTPLMVAVKEGKEKLVALLLAKGANPDTTNPRTGSTALIEAVVKENAAIAKTLLAKGADVNGKAKVTGATALMHAVLKSNFDIAKMLLERGADINAKNKWGQTALSIARRKKTPGIEKLLLKHGAK